MDFCWIVDGGGGGGGIEGGRVWRGARRTDLVVAQEVACVRCLLCDCCHFWYGYIMELGVCTVDILRESNDKLEGVK